MKQIEYKKYPGSEPTKAWNGFESICKDIVYSGTLDSTTSWREKDKGIEAQINRQTELIAKLFEVLHEKKIINDNELAKIFDCVEMKVIDE